MGRKSALQVAIEHCRHEYGSANVPDVIPIDFGVGIKFKDDKGVEYTTAPRSDHQYINCRITSFRGMSPGAIHYYGKIRISDPSLIYIEDGKQRKCSIGGYFDRHKPNEAKGIEIDVVRKLTQKEIDEEPQRWERYDAGDETNCWENEEELIDVIKKIIKHRFKGWKYRIEDSWGRYAAGEKYPGE
jgi:hypothetical protein